MLEFLATSAKTTVISLRIPYRQLVADAGIFRLQKFYPPAELRCHLDLPNATQRVHQAIVPLRIVKKSLD
jgi:hypothetical protein